MRGKISATMHWELKQVVWEEAEPEEGVVEAKFNYQRELDSAVSDNDKQKLDSEVLTRLKEKYKNMTKDKQEIVSC